MFEEPAPMAWNYCPTCGTTLESVHDGESYRPRCAKCLRFFYSNPVPAACCLVRRDDALLFVQRAIEPRKGLWTLPGGFVELGETTEQAALRELEEETNLRGAGLHLVAVSTQPSQLSGGVVVLGYRVEAWDGDPIAATDAMALGFFPRAARPPIAFKAHIEILEQYDALTGASGHGR